MEPSVFHVKPRFPWLNEVILLPYTKLPEDDIQNVLHVNPTEQPPQGKRRCSQLLGGQFLALADHGDAALERIRRLLHELPLPLARNQASFARPEIILGEGDQSADQLGDPEPAARRNPELGHWPTTPACLHGI